MLYSLRTVCQFLVLAAVLATTFALPTLTQAAPTQYQLDAKASRVGFDFVLGGAHQKGTMPVSRATVLIDPANLTASRVDISLNVKGVRSPLPFVKPALVGPQVLDVARFPTIRFVSTRVQLGPNGRISDGAKISGKLTIHGVTKPVTFAAGLFRAPGSDVDDLSELTVRLSGQINRNDFGATGFADLVGPIITLDISAVVRLK